MKEINGKETVELRVSLRMEKDRMAASWPVAEEEEGAYRWNVYAADYPLEIEDASGNTPDSVLRVMMAWKPSREKAEIRAQSFEHFERKGFMVVEWGGYEIDERE